MSPYLRVDQRLHAEVVDSLGLHEVLHVELVRPSLSQVGQAEVEPLRVPVGVDVERQLKVVLRLLSGATEGHNDGL